MTRIAAEVLARLMTGALRRRGLSPEHAGFVVAGLVETSLRGVDTHGIRLFPVYLAELDGGRAKAMPQVRWSGRGAARLLDAGGALGLVAGRLACREVARLAREHGVGVVVVRGSNHFGAASSYALDLARQGLVGVAASNSDALVAPFNGRAPFFGTNPLAVAASGVGEETFSADFATSQVAYSRVKTHRERGQPLEPGWAVGPDGEDASAAGKAAGTAGEVAALAPLGGAVAGHKGQGLAMIVEILCAVLAGEPPDHELSHLFVPPFDEPRRVAHFFLGLDPEAFGGAGGFRARLSALLGETRAQPARPGERVRVPGDPEAEAMAERRARGIPLGEEELAWVRGLAAEVGEELALMTDDRSREMED